MGGKGKAGFGPDPFSRERTDAIRGPMTATGQAQLKVSQMRSARNKSSLSPGRIFHSVLLYSLAAILWILLAEDLFRFLGFPSAARHLGLGLAVFTVMILALHFWKLRWSVTEGKLEVGRELFARVVETIADGIFIIDDQGRLIFANPAAERIIGRSSRELRQLRPEDPVFMATTPDGEPVPKERTPFYLVMKNNEPLFGEEYRLRRPDGSEVLVSSNISPLRDADGRARGVVAIVRDITLQERARNALRESEEKYRRLVEASTDAILLETLDFRILDCNSAALKMFGYSKDEMINLRVFDLVPEEVAKTLPRLANEDLTTGGFFIEAWNQRRDGSVFPVEVSTRLLEIGGEKLVIAFVRDLTLRKQAEEALAEEKERLAVTLRSIGDGVITTDTAGRVALLNPVAEKLTGFSQEESRGRPLGEVFRIVNENTRRPCENPVEKVMRSGAVIGLANHTLLLGRDGAERVIADSGSPIRDREGRIIGVVLVFRDVTEKRRAEEQMQKSEKLESLGLLAGGIAHDFNNILSGILGNISIAQQAEDRERISPRLAEAEKACLRARDLTQQLLTFSQGGMPVKVAASLRELIAESARFALHGSKARLELELPEDLWPAEVDRSQISQVIQNLVQNADQAMPGGGAVRIAAENYTQPEPGACEPSESAIRPGAYLRILVAEEGVGIPEEHRSKIFDPFFTTKEKGSGIGLTTSHSIVSKHEGYILVDSVLGRGSRFFVYLPAQPRASLPEAEAEGRLWRGSGRVLAMDDEGAILEVLAMMLTELGYEAETARTGEEAVARFAAARQAGRPFAAVILDLTVPGKMGGQATLAKLGSLSPEVKAIVSSGYSTDPVMSRHQEHGFDGVMTKPYDLSTLSRALHRVLGHNE